MMEMGLRSALKALTGIHNTDQGLTAASRDDNLTTASHGQLVECFLLMGAKGDQGVCPVDTTSITPHGIRGRCGVTLCRLALCRGSNTSASDTSINN